jgi:hypothetical protein
MPLLALLVLAVAMAMGRILAVALAWETVCWAAVAVATGLMLAILGVSVAVGLETQKSGSTINKQSTNQRSTNNQQINNQQIINRSTINKQSADLNDLRGKPHSCPSSAFVFKVRIEPQTFWSERFQCAILPVQNNNVVILLSFALSLSASQRFCRLLCLYLQSHCRI